jgi:DNA-binding NarL/FixJ family response regulator
MVRADLLLKLICAPRELNPDSFEDWRLAWRVGDAERIMRAGANRVKCWDYVRTKIRRMKTPSSVREAQRSPAVAVAASGGFAGVLQGVRRIMIVEDHPVFREGLVQMLAGEEDLAVAGECGSAEAGFKAFLRLKPDMVVVDLSLPGQSGLELIRQIRAINREVKLLVVSMHDEAVYADRVLSAGADGYIMKQEDFNEILHAVRDVLSGHIYLSEAVLARSQGDLESRTRDLNNQTLNQLSDSELEILELLGQGRSNREIGKQLGFAVKRVDVNCRQLCKKLELDNYNQLIRYAVCWLETSAR